MDPWRGTVSLAGVTAMAMVAVLAFSSTAPPAASGAQAILAPTDPGTVRGDYVGPGGREASDAPLQLAALDGPAPQAAWGIYQGEPVVILKLESSTLRAASEVHGRNLGQYAVVHPFEDDTVLVAYSGKSTHLGCTLAWAPALGGSLAVPDYDEDGTLDGRLLDPCHQGQWDVYAMGENQPETIAPEPLDPIRLHLRVTFGTATLWGVERIPQDAPFDADRQGPGAPFALDG